MPIVTDLEIHQRAYDRALRFLAYRPRSAEEIRRHLGKKDLPPDVIASVIERLIGRGYLDDVEFARSWIDNRDRFKPMSARALRYELRQKGVNDAIVDELLADVDDDETAFRAAQAWAPRCRGGARDVFRKKLSAMLQRRGFGRHAINQAILRLQAELEACDPNFFPPESPE